MRYFYLLTCILLLSLSTALYSAQHKLIFLLATPRSLSTPFTRMMANRGDFECYSEPCMPVFFQQENPEFGMHFNESASTSYCEILEKIQKSREKGPVFVKELGNRILKVLELAPELYSDPDVHFIFLLRDPHEVAISLYRGLKKMTLDIKTQNISDLIMHEELWNTFCSLCSRTVNSPLFIFSQNLCADPLNTISGFCEALGISFSPHHLLWSSCNLKSQQVPQWNEVKLFEQSLVWDEALLKSSCFSRQNTYQRDANGFPTFEEIENLPDRQLVIKAYKHNLAYFHSFADLKTYHLSSTKKCDEHL